MSSSAALLFILCFFKNNYVKNFFIWKNKII